MYTTPKNELIAVVTENLFLGGKLLEVSIGKEFMALKGFKV